MKNRTIRGNEHRLALASILAALAIGIGGYFVSNSYLASIAANLSTTMFGVGIGLYLVNLFLERDARKQAVMSLLKLVAPSIQEHHNALLIEAWNRFGKPQWGELLKRYASNGGDPHALTPEERNKIYGMVKSEKAAYETRFLKLESELRELALILGWTFKPSILSSSFNCRFAITKLRAASFDDSEPAKLEVCERFLDVELTSSAVFHELVELLGLDKKGIYSERE